MRTFFSFVNGSKDQINPLYGMYKDKLLLLMDVQVYIGMNIHVILNCRLYLCFVYREM